MVLDTFLSSIRKILRPLGVGRFIEFIRRRLQKAYLRMPRLFLALKFYFFNSLITNFPSFKVRTRYLKSILKISIGHKTSIHMNCFLAGNNIQIGHNTVIARNCYLDGRVGLIRIMNNVSIAPDVAIMSMTHLVNSPTFEVISKTVQIEDYVWIGTRVLIMPGINIGKGAVVGAGSIVTKNVEPYTIVAGNPAKKIGERSKELFYELNYFPYFNTDIQR
jgi:acetyltransferase-like isoleucine patch superfamily enzyme